MSKSTKPAGALDNPLGFTFPGGKYTIAHWENFLLTDCTTSEQLPDKLVHPVALFHVPILGSGINIAKLFEVCGAEGPGTVGLDGYDWEYFEQLRIEVEYDVQGSIVHWESKVDSKGNAYDAMKFQIELHDGNTLAARITNSWRFRRSGYKQSTATPGTPRTGESATPAMLESLPEFHVASVDAQRMKTMAAILRDPYRVHWDRQATRDMGLDGKVINQGPLNLSYIVNALHAHAGAGSVRRLIVAFHRPVFDGDTLVAGGEILAVSNDIATCDVWLKRGDEIMVSGTALVSLANSFRG